MKKEEKEKKLKKGKKPVNIMRRKRFPFMDIWAETGRGFGHSRGR